MLRDVLRWDRVEGPLEVYEKEFESRAESRLGRAIAECGEVDSRISEGLRDIIANAPILSVCRVAVAPELEYKLRRSAVGGDGRRELVTFLRTAFEAEAALSAKGVYCPEAEEAWTALGDYRIRCGHREPIVKIDEYEGGSEPTCSIVCECRLAGRIPVDYESPYNRADFSLRFPQFSALPEVERERVSDKLAGALEIVRRGGSQVERFVFSFTRVIVPSVIPDVGKSCGSFSSSWYPGRSVLINPHLPVMTQFDMAAALVHEAIHSVIDISELGSRLIAPGYDLKPSVFSPWTGAKLSLQSLLDAYFVWFGLLRFWMRVGAHNGTDGGALAHRMYQCRNGFVQSLDDVCGSAINGVHQFARKKINELRDEVLAASKC